MPAAAPRAAGPSSETMEEGALFILGMDNLGALEDLFGEALGDSVAAAVHKRLSSVLPAGARFWRAEHRRYALAVEGMGREAASALFARMQAIVAQDAIPTAQGPVAVTVAAGCSLGGGELESLIADARYALTDAMRRGAGCIRFSELKGSTIHLRHEIAAAAQIAMGAVGSGDLTIAFQPVVGANSTGRAAFHECLVRVRDPEGWLVPAAKFMPAMEQLGLAPLIDRQVLVMALDALARNPGIRLSVNIFPQTMQDAQWMILFRDGLRKDSTLAERLIIEVTETAAMLDPARTQDFMDKLRRTGCAFALDDFGMGHTSFGNLRDFRFDMIKIDGSFITNVTSNADNRFFVSKLVEIGKHFEMLTVAEFVQGPAEARVLRDLGVGYFQGFYFGTPCLLLDAASNPEPMVIRAR
ncbi:MAG TPA: GGDEF domain-containing phosphodiesterase [Thermohalobaculum sp.]|nr:GGDEF domain-containing phosphodiesterase [Thermohalobaculum sp.]